MSTDVVRTTRPAAGATPRASAPGAAGTPDKPGPSRATLLVAEREVLVQVRSKSFLISTVVLLLLVVGSIVVSALLSDRESADTEVGVVAAAQDVVRALDGYAGVPFADEDAAREAVRSGEVEAAVVPDPGPTGVRVIALSSPPGGLVDALVQAPEVEVLEPSAADGGLRYLVSFAFGLVFLISASGFGTVIAQNTVQEKQSRVVELLLASVSARTLMAGKILGNSLLAFAQTAAIAAAAVLGLVVTGQDDLLGLIGAPVVWFVLFFVVGFVLLAAIFAASASLVSRQEDVGAVLSPATILVMTPYFLVIFLNENETVLRVMSYVPFSAPVAMPVRLFLGEAEWWEPLVSLGILVVSAGLVITLAATIYERSLLRTGARVRLREVLSRS